MLKEKKTGMKFEQRTYRRAFKQDRLVGFQVIVKETDLHVQAEKNLYELTLELVLEYRGYLEAFIRQHPDFATAMIPWLYNQPAPNIVQAMISAALSAHVGPMAAVAGAVAESVGTALLAHSSEVIIENGGDIFMKVNRPALVGVYAGRSPLSMKIGLRLPARGTSFGVCTSSGTVGHSISFGSADAVCVISSSCSLADAAATAIGNQVNSVLDIGPAIDWGCKIAGVEGILIVKDDKIGAWGDLEVAPLSSRSG